MRSMPSRSAIVRATRTMCPRARALTSNARRRGRGRYHA
jgi:hypothetical protein